MSPLRKIKTKIKHLIEPLLENLASRFNKDVIQSDQKSWEAVAQKNEFAFHKQDKWRQTDDFMNQSALLFSSWGFKENDFADKIILDLGAGSKLRGKYFKNAKIIALEPMADDCIKEIPWTDLPDAHKIYSLPAEERIKELENSVDFLFSINVLDHCFNFKKIISNIHAYLKPGAVAFLSFDSHFITDKMHPLILTDPICCEIFEAEGFLLEKKSKGFGEALPTRTYGHGSYCLNYWLKKVV